MTKAREDIWCWNSRFLWQLGGVLAYFFVDFWAYQQTDYWCPLIYCLTFTWKNHSRKKFVSTKLSSKGTPKTAFIGCVSLSFKFWRNHPFNEMAYILSELESQNQAQRIGWKADECGIKDKLVLSLIAYNGQCLLFRAIFSTKTTFLSWVLLCKNVSFLMPFVFTNDFCFPREIHTDSVSSKNVVKF